MSHGAIVRGDTSLKKIALVFTADEFGDGGTTILNTLKNHHIKGSFFFTGNFYNNASFKRVIQKLKNRGHYLGSHSDKHLLYCDWGNRDSLLVTKEQFEKDLSAAYHSMKPWGINKKNAQYFLPPYEWYNDSIAAWTSGMGLQLVNFSPGTRSNADYTTPDMGKKYFSSDEVMKSVFQFELNSANGMNGFILLIHFGTHPDRTDKFYNQLPTLINGLKELGYEFVRIDELLN